MERNNSEVARLREQITAEYESAVNARCFAQTAKHQFIAARMERIGSYQEQLIALVGEDEALQIIIEVNNAVVPAAPPVKAARGG